VEDRRRERRGRHERRDPPRALDNEGHYHIIPGREREAQPTYLNALNTTSKYYEGGLGDRAWRKKKQERAGLIRPPRIDSKWEPPQSSK
jgi:hypothetical protein